MTDKEKETYLLEQLIKFWENDMLMDVEDGHCTSSDYKIMTELIIGLTRYINDIRYCSRANCPCSPEYQIKRKYDQIKHLLKGTNTALHPIPWKTLEKITGLIT